MMRSKRVWESLVVGALLWCAGPVWAQPAPAWSRGLQLLSIRVGEASRRAEAAMQAEGYSVTNRSNPSEDSFFLGGQKGPHSAIIMCDRNADGRTWVNIVVASTSSDGGVPGLERQRLQARMDNTTMPTPTGPPYTGTPPPPPYTGTPPRGPVVTGTRVNGGWSTQANELEQDMRSKVGKRYSVTIPGGGHAENIWGTDLYTADSRIGTAAVHAGLISFERGGTVTVEIRPAADGYRGTSRNGIASSDFGYYPLSFEFVGDLPGGYGVPSGPAAGPPDLQNPQGMAFPGYLPIAVRDQVGRRFTFLCLGRDKADGYIQGSNLYGTDVYTEDTGVCSAAVHSGLMTFQAGGVVTVEIRGSQQNFIGSTRYGVTSLTYTHGSTHTFVFVR